MPHRAVRVAALVVGGLVAAAAPAAADEVAQPLPLLQSWTDITRLDQNDDWSLIPGIVGRGGINLADGVGVDPRTVLVDSSLSPIDIRVNRDNANGEFGGVIELEGDNPTVALQASNAVDAPHLMIAIDTTGVSAVRVQYDLVDVDDGAENVEGAVALQWRIGSVGPYRNVPGGFVADATDGGVAGRRTHVDVMLPELAGDKPRIELRVMITDRDGQDEWIGVDDIAITASTAPTGTGEVEPAAVTAGAATRLTIDVEPGLAPASTEIGVRCDITAVGGPADRPLFDDGQHEDGDAGDRRFARAIIVGPDTPAGVAVLPCQIRDAEGRSSTIELTVTVLPVCGDGRIEATETCDDGNPAAGDGCAACAITAGWACSGAPSTCADVDECADGRNDCAPDAGCTNLTGSFACWCPDGWAGDGRSPGTGCTEIDECAEDLDDCAPLATCANTVGSFACACPGGHAGDGHDDGTGCSDLDECSDGSAGCSPFATCGNLPGSFTCTCATGFTGDGQACTPRCGDGLRVLDEACDDGNTGDGDGCDAACDLEDGFVCSGQPTTCIADRDADGVPDVEDNCVGISNQSQTDADGDGLGAACDDDDEPEEPPPPPESGGCATGGAPGPGAVALLALLTLLGRRRRRSAPAASAR